MTTLRRTPLSLLFALAVTLALPLLLLAACTPTPARIVIDWADSIHFDGIDYVRALPPVTFDESALGPQYAEVQFNVSENVHTLGYHVKHGDAAFLQPGTPIYEVAGYAATFRLAAFRDDRLIVYEVYSNPAATLGADLLDIEGKVISISINSEFDGTTQLAIIDNPVKVTVLVAPVDQRERDHDDTLYFIAFHLADDTQTVTAYWPATGELHLGIMLPPEFATAIEQALAAP